MIKRTPFVLAGTIAGLAGLLSFRSTPASMTLGTVAAAASNAAATPTSAPATSGSTPAGADPELAGADVGVVAEFEAAEATVPRVIDAGVERKLNRPASPAMVPASTKGVRLIIRS